MHHTAFVILLTFMVGTASHDALKTIHCRNQRCVDRVVGAAHLSPCLVRLRVFRGDPGDLGNGAAVQQPLIDEWLS